MENLLRDALTLWGPLAIGWILAAYLVWYVLSERKKPNETIAAYQNVLNDYHTALVANTKAIERLAIIIEERTRRQSERSYQAE